MNHSSQKIAADHGAMAYAVGSQMNATKPAPAPANPTCFGTIEHAAMQACDAAANVERCVSRLCGHQPEPPQPGAEMRPMPCLLDGAMDHAMQIHAAASRINAAMDRLEKSLP